VLLTYQNRDTVAKDLDRLGGVAVVRSDFDHFLQKAIDAGHVSTAIRHSTISNEEGTASRPTKPIG
jgi:hypothetical protein